MKALEPKTKEEKIADEIRMAVKAWPHGAAVILLEAIIHGLEGNNHVHDSKPLLGLKGDLYRALYHHSVSSQKLEQERY